MASRRTQAAHGERASELLTLWVHPAAASTATACLLVSGWSLVELGLAAPRFDHTGVAAIILVALIVTIVGIFGVWSMTRRLATTGDATLLLRVLRLLVGTALGEEVLFRSFLLAVWTATDASAMVSTVANMVTFGLWHVAGARGQGEIQVDEILVPAAGTLLFLWGRLLSSSIAIPWMLHAATNLAGWALRERHDPPV